MLTCAVLAEDGDIQGTLARTTGFGPSLAMHVTRNEGSPFSLSREAIASGAPPRHTLLVTHPSQWRDYVSSLRSRGVLEVVSIVLELNHTGTGPQPHLLS